MSVLGRKRKLAPVRVRPPAGCPLSARSGHFTKFLCHELPSFGEHVHPMCLSHNVVEGAGDEI